MDILMSHTRILLIAIAIGFVGGFSFVALADDGARTAEPGYSAAG
jgi:hypothetical protein